MTRQVFQIDYLFLCRRLNDFSVPTFYPQRELSIWRLVFDDLLLLSLKRRNHTQCDQNGREESYYSHFNRSRSRGVAAATATRYYAPQETESKASTFRDRSCFLSILLVFCFFILHAFHRSFPVDVKRDRNRLATTPRNAALHQRLVIFVQDQVTRR